jgi:hypothetical protein
MKTLTYEEAALFCEKEAANLKSAIEISTTDRASAESITMLNAQFAEAEILALKFRQGS